MLKGRHGSFIGEKCCKRIIPPGWVTRMGHHDDWLREHECGGCHVTSWLISSPPPLRRAKQRQLLPSRLPSVPSFAARLRLRLPSHILILFPSVTSEEVHSGQGHGAQIHRWSNVCRSQGLHKLHCWEKVARPLHFIHPACVNPGISGISRQPYFTMHCVSLNNTARGSCMQAACNLALLQNHLNL